MLLETIQLINEKFRSSHYEKGFTIGDKTLDQLFFMTDKWIMPYLNFIKENKHIYKVIHTNSVTFGVENTYNDFFYSVFSPILLRFGVLKEKHEYVMTFYRHGFTAILMKWVNNDCKESTE